MDVNCEDWRSRDIMWDQTRHALEFFHDNLPFWEVAPDNDLASRAKGARILAKAGEVYAVQLPAGGTARLEVPEGEYSVQWYNPRAGGELQQGRVKSIKGPGERSLGRAPADPMKDWVVLVKKT